MVNYPYLICTLPHTITIIIYLISSQLSPNSFLYFSHTICQMHIYLSFQGLCNFLFLLLGRLSQYILKIHFLTAFMSLCKCHLLSKAFSLTILLKIAAANILSTFPVSQFSKTFMMP